MAEGTHRDDPGAVRRRGAGAEAYGEGEVPGAVDGEPGFPAVRCAGEFRQGHDAGMAQQLT
ncbi:hypothetical protein BIV23_20635 [Streptomyces monashensis]|uniref:Uncharacterized protein n=1 Tax=Streptomyces monashensis TaxID=1678012 RepID=A0A1S2QBY0_9ACTN|nr:hypothetical protein BIV23_20635 [Streptomyces monashensis]